MQSKTQRSLFLSLTAALAASAATAQIPCYSPQIGANLGLGDEQMSAAQPLGFAFPFGGATYTDLQVGDNGYVSLGAAGGVAYWQPTAQRLVSDAFASIRPLWVDLDPSAAGSGGVHFQAVAAQGGTPAHAIVTWDGVRGYGIPSAHSVQLVLIDGGAVRVHYGHDLATLPASWPWLVGASPGQGAATNPVSFQSLPLLTSGAATFHEAGVGGLALAGRTFDWLPDGIGGYAVVENTQCPSALPYGKGCVAQYASFYERFASTPTIDLANRAFHLAHGAGGYAVAAAATPFVAPSPAAANLALTDDSEAVVALSSPFAYPGGVTSQLVVCSNGHVAAASNGAMFDYTPSADDLLAWPNATWAVWRDLIPNAAGNVWFEEAGGRAIVTWLGVVGYQGTAAGSVPSTFQLQFELATGDVHFVFQSLDTTSLSGWSGGDGWLVGYSAPGASLDPASIDLDVAAATGFGVAVADAPALGLRVGSLPAVGTVVAFDTVDIPTGAPFGVLLFGVTPYVAGVPLDAIGMEGCSGYHDAVVGVSFVAGGPTATVPLAIPNVPGAAFQAQSVVYAPQAPRTSSGLLASGALHLTVY
jgi:hypothetical protein